MMLPGFAGSDYVAGPALVIRSEEELGDPADDEVVRLALQA